MIRYVDGASTRSKKLTTKSFRILTGTSCDQIIPSISDMKLLEPLHAKIMIHALFIYVITWWITF